MRYVDASTPEPADDRDTDPWRIEDDRLLKTSEHSHPLLTEADAQRVLDAYRVAYEAGAGTPRPYEVVRSEEGFGVVVEYVRGIWMGPHIVFGSYTPQEAGQALGELMWNLHAITITEGRDVKATFRSYARSLAPLLPNDVGEQLAILVDSIPDSQTLLHGDLHIGNVVIRHGKPTLIDMELVGFGHPIFDLAITRSRMLLGGGDQVKNKSQELTRKTSAVVWENLFTSYCEAAGIERSQELERITALLAEMERCCFNYRVGHSDGLPEGWRRERVDLHLERICSLSAEAPDTTGEAGST